MSGKDYNYNQSGNPSGVASDTTGRDTSAADSSREYGSGSREYGGSSGTNTGSGYGSRDTTGTDSSRGYGSEVGGVNTRSGATTGYQGDTKLSGAGAYESREYGTERNPPANISGRGIQGSTGRDTGDSYGASTGSNAGSRISGTDRHEADLSGRHKELGTASNASSREEGDGYAHNKSGTASGVATDITGRDITGRDQDSSSGYGNERGGSGGRGGFSGGSSDKSDQYGSGRDSGFSSGNTGRNDPLESTGRTGYGSRGTAADEYTSTESYGGLSGGNELEGVGSTGLRGSGDGNKAGYQDTPGHAHNRAHGNESHETRAGHMLDPHKSLDS